jgi:membrane associated rhomboid family serine protease
MQYQFIFDDRSSFYFIVLYFGALLISVTPTYKKHRDNMGYNALGASGAVSAVLFANIFLNPWQKVYLYGLISLPGILAGTAYLIYSHYMGKRGGDNINHDAHFWGAVFGVIFTVCLKPSLFSDFISKMMHFY